MKNLNTKLYEAYEEAVDSIMEEGKTSRLCRFYCYTIDEDGASLDSALINVSINTTLKEDELYNLFTENEKHSRVFKTEEEAMKHMNKKIEKGSKSTFCYVIQ